MKRLSKQQKVEKYLIENRVFPLSTSNSHESWGVEGTTVYSVMYDKIKQTYSCTCNNVRCTDCAHIVCVKTIKNDL